MAESRIDFRVVNAALDAATVVPQWLPNGKRQGAEWVTTNPTRNDQHAGSFSVKLTTGQWADFVTKDRGGDLVGLYAYINGLSQLEAARELMRTHGIVDNVQTREQAHAKGKNVLPIDENKPQPVFPVPADAPPLENFKHWKFGEASRVWQYRDREGRLLCHIARYDVEPRKQIVPWSWAFDPKRNAHRWANVGFSGSKPRPLYGLEKLAAYPEHDILLVEGEKAADAAQAIMGDACLVLSWMGGTAAADKVHLAHLKGRRRVFLWPDFDAQREKPTNGEDADGMPLLPIHKQPGAAAMLTIADRLRGLVDDAAISMVHYTMLEKPDGWDLADGQAEGITGEDVLRMLSERAQDPRAFAMGEAPKAAGSQAEPSKAAPLALPVNPFGFPDRSEKGPQDTIENMAYMLDQYGITVRYNVIAKDIEISIPGENYSQDNHTENCFSTIESLCARNQMSRGNVRGYVINLADKRPYNPAAEWIDSKPWDGQDRIGPLAASLDPKNGELAHILLRKWMIGAVASVFEPRGFSMQGAIVLQGAQGLGKTTWIMSMANNDRSLIKEAAVLNTDKQDTIKQAISHWLVELGELEATFSKSDITALRGFITMQMDEMRLPYAKASSKYPRRTAFLASVNDKAYLRDETGNRRYWTIECGDGMNAMHGINMQQAWAQAKQLYLAGEQHHLTRDENALLAEHNLSYTEQNPIDELIGGYYDWAAPAAYRTTATDVVIAIGYTKPTAKETKAAAAALRKYTGKEPKKYNGRLVFEVPPCRNNSTQIYNDDQNRPF
jgi:putative DNA primase/helicase